MPIPQQSPALKAVLKPIERFMSLETSGSILLLICTAIAMIWANSPWHDVYHNIVHYPIGLKLGDWIFEKSLSHWVNDGLMVIFFFVVGMEIKYELVAGELASPRKAALPIIAAIGGMLGPAIIYASFNMNGEGAHGWGIPTATDIAFAVGVLTLVGKRVPFGLKVFLLALAIVDDLGAVLVIAFFYTSDLSAQALFTGIGVLGLIYMLRQAGVRPVIVYVILGTIAWFAILKSGIHATIAGVTLGFLTPHKPWFPKEELPETFDKHSKEFVSSVRSLPTDQAFELHDSSVGILKTIKQMILEAESPLDRLVHTLHPWVTYLIMPIFAFVNAGVEIGEINVSEIASHPIFLGVGLGLFLGKPIGIMVSSFLATKIGLADLPKGVTWGHILGAGLLAGVGFTMALFVSGLSFLSHPELEVFSKTGILIGSTSAAIIGGIYLLIYKGPQAKA